MVSGVILWVSETFLLRVSGDIPHNYTGSLLKTCSVRCTSVDDRETHAKPLVPRAVVWIKQDRIHVDLPEELLYCYPASFALHIGAHNHGRLRERQQYFFHL